MAPADIETYWLYFEIFNRNKRIRDSGFWVFGKERYGFGFKPFLYERCDINSIFSFVKTRSSNNTRNFRSVLLYCTKIAKVFNGRAFCARSNLESLLVGICTEKRVDWLYLCFPCLRRQPALCTAKFTTEVCLCSLRVGEENKSEARHLGSVPQLERRAPCERWYGQSRFVRCGCAALWEE